MTAKTKIRQQEEVKSIIKRNDNYDFTKSL